MDGKIVIGTEIDTKKFEKQLAQLEKESTRLKDKKVKLDLDETKALNNLQKVDDKLEILNQKIAEFEQNNIPSVRAESLEYQEMISQREQLNAKGEEYLQQLDMIKSKQNDINNAIQMNADAIDNVKSSLGIIPINVEQIGTKLKDITKKVVKWGLAIFGVRSAYMAIRQAMSILASYNPQMAKDIEYIKVALASTLQPVIERIINLVKTLLQYVGYIAKAWFNIDIFKNASKYLKNANGEAKKLSKTMAGFDEMNVLSDTSSGGGVSGGANFDIKPLEDADAPTWLKWIAENRDLIIGALAGIALGLLAIKLADPTTWIVLAIALLAGLITAIVTNWDKIKNVLINVGTWIYKNVILPVVNVFKALWEFLVKIFTPIIEFFKSIFTTVWENIKIIFGNIAKIFVFVWDKLKEVFAPVVEFFKNVFNKAFEAIKNIFNPIIDFFAKLWDKIKDKLKAFGTKVGEIIGSAFKNAFNGIMKVIENFLNAPIKAINGLIKVINKVPGINLDKLTEFKLPRLARGGIVNNPGKGVMMGSYIAGERGSEAVIPLDDATMDRLGEAIARHMSITNDNKIFMNARQIARQMNITNAENAFATNS